MKKNNRHWTAKNIANYVFSIGADFVAQLEAKLEESHIAQNALSTALNITKGAVSQALNNPGNLTIRSMVKYARAVGMDVSVVLYKKTDELKEWGPIHADIFRICWERAGKPKDFFEVQSLPATVGIASNQCERSLNALPGMMTACEPKVRGLFISYMDTEVALESEGTGIKWGAVDQQEMIIPHGLYGAAFSHQPRKAKLEETVGAKA